MRHITDLIYKEKCKPEFIQKLDKWVQLNQLVGAIIGMGILLLLATPVLTLTQHAYEKWSPRGWWFAYSSIVPAHPEFKKGETPEFISSAEYRQEVKVQWFDTLWCDTGTQVKRLKTQITPDQPTVQFVGVIGQADASGNYPTWEYNAQTVPANAISCRMNSYIEVTTPLGYKKSQLVLVDWFGVNK